MYVYEQKVWSLSLKKFKKVSRTRRAFHSGLSTEDDGILKGVFFVVVVLGSRVRFAVVLRGDGWKNLENFEGTRTT